MVAALIAWLLALPPTHLVTAQDQVGELRVVVTVVAADDDYARDATLAVLVDVANTTALLSNSDSRSEIARINRERSAQVMPDVLGVLRRSMTVARITNNAFAMTRAPLTRLWGFDNGKVRIPIDAEVRAALPLVDDSRVSLGPDNRVQLPERVALEATSVRGGYAVDRALALLRSRGFSHALVAVQGDVGAIGKKPEGPWRVGIQDPGARGIFAVMSLRDRVSVTVGDYQRYADVGGSRYHHVLDPRSGRPAASCRSVTVLGPDGVTASAFAHAVFVLGPDAGMRLIRARKELDAVIVDRDNRVRATFEVEKVRPPTPASVRTASAR